MGVELSLDHRLNISVALRGRKLSSEHVQKMRKTLTGRKLTAEHRSNISKALKGIPRTVEANAQRSAARKEGIASGRIKINNKAGLAAMHSPEGRAKCAAANKKHFGMRYICRGIVFDDIHACARHNKVRSRTVAAHLARHGHLDSLGERNNPNWADEYHEWKTCASNAKH